MNPDEPLPIYRFRRDMPGLWDMARHGISDTAAVIPESILVDRSVQLPSGRIGPSAPLIVSDPELARLVLVDRADNFGRNAMMRRLMRRAWGNGLAGAEGESWQQQRHAAAPAFRPQAVAEHAARFAQAAADVMHGLPSPAPLDLGAIAAAIVARVVFDVLVRSGEAIDPDEVARDIPAYVGRIARFGLSDLWPLPEAWHDRLGGVDRDPTVKRMRAIARTIATSHTTASPARDLIDLLTQAGPVEDNIRGLFPAAIDTTVKALSWTLFVLACRPDWQDRLAAEALGCDGPPTLDRLPLTRSVVQEVLRLYPPGPMLVRNALVDMVLDNKPVRAGQTVAVSIYAMHRHRAHWERPDSFEPERFLRNAGPHAAYMPFGIGPRTCLAAQFALGEIVAIVAEIVRRRALTRVGPMPEIGLQITTHARQPLRATASVRVS